MVLLQIGSMPHELAIENIDRFAREVLPQLRGNVGRRGLVNHWWPERLRGAASAPRGRRRRGGRGMTREQTIRRLAGAGAHARAVARAAGRRSSSSTARGVSAGIRSSTSWRAPSPSTRRSIPARRPTRRTTSTTSTTCGTWCSATTSCCRRSGCSSAALRRPLVRRDGGVRGGGGVSRPRQPPGPDRPARLLARSGPDPQLDGDGPRADARARLPRSQRRRGAADVRRRDERRSEGRGAARVRLMWALGATGKFLWPIPDKGLKKRIHRVTAPTLLVWGKEDRLVPPVYADEFTRRLARRPRAHGRRRRPRAPSRAAGAGRPSGAGVPDRVATEFLGAGPRPA